MSTQSITAEMNRSTAGASVGHGGLNNTKGNFNGVTLQVINTASLIANAQEELGFSLQGKVGADLAQRKVIGSKANSHAQAAKIEKLLETMFSGEQREKINAMVNELVSGDAVDEAKLARVLERYSIDFSEQYAALMAIRRFLLKSEGAALLPALKLVNAKIASFEATGEIQSGRKIAAKGILDIRSQYCNAVVNFESLSAVWHYLVTMYGKRRWKKAKCFLLNALAEECEMAGSELDDNRLVSIMADMNKIKMLSAIYESCEETASVLRYEG